MIEISVSFNCVIDQTVGYAKTITLLATSMLGEGGNSDFAKPGAIYFHTTAFEMTAFTNELTNIERKRILFTI